MGCSPCSKFCTEHGHAQSQARSRNRDVSFFAGSERRAWQVICTRWCEDRFALWTGLPKILLLRINSDSQAIESVHPGIESPVWGKRTAS